MDSPIDLIVIGSGAAGMMAAIAAARAGKEVLLLEKLSRLGAKLKATGGGRCNFTNTQSTEEFISRFGRNGRFMTPALEALDHEALISFFREIGVESHAPDGFRVFPQSHSSSTVLEGLEGELHRLGVQIKTGQPVKELLTEDHQIRGVKCAGEELQADQVILAVGGRGFPKLGAQGDGYAMAEALGHRVTPIHPAMLPLKCRDSWVAKCTADTIAKAEVRIDLPKQKKLRATGDLIFTKEGIRGPVVLDFAREITPLLAKHGEVPLLINLTKGMNEDGILSHFKELRRKTPQLSVLQLVESLLPPSVARELCNLAGAEGNLTFKKLPGEVKDRLVRLLAWTPLRVTGHQGWDQAMITRGGISLKEIRPNTMGSKFIRGLYFCGEIVDLDGPCGGYNLQWAFSSGYLAGQLL